MRRQARLPCNSRRPRTASPMVPLTYSRSPATRPRPQHGLALRHQPERRDGDGQGSWRRRGVAADKANAGLLLHRARDPAAKRLKPCRGGLPEREGQQIDVRLRALGGEIGEIDARAPCGRCCSGGSSGQEMHALDDGVTGERRSPGPRAAGSTAASSRSASAAASLASGAK